MRKINEAIQTSVHEDAVQVILCMHMNNVSKQIETVSSSTTLYTGIQKQKYKSFQNVDTKINTITEHAPSKKIMTYIYILKFELVLISINI